MDLTIDNLKTQQIMPGVYEVPAFREDFEYLDGSGDGFVMDGNPKEGHYLDFMLYEWGDLRGKAIDVIRSLAQLQQLPAFQPTDSYLGQSIYTGRSSTYVPYRFNGSTIFMSNDSYQQEETEELITTLKGVYGTKTTGRKVILDPEVAKNLQLYMPFSVSEGPDKVYLSVKGNRPNFKGVVSENFRGKQSQIDGFTAYVPEENKITKILTEKRYKVKDLWGRNVDHQYIPGRFMVASFPIRRVLTDDDQRIEITDEENPGLPLATGENRLHVQVDANWSAYTYQDIFNVLYESGYDPKTGIDLLRQVAKDLSAHPEFYTIFKNENIDDYNDEDFLLKFLPEFILRETNKNYVEAQIEAQAGVFLAYRHDQNRAIGGKADFEESFVLPRHGYMSSDELNKDSWNVEQMRLYRFIGSISKVIRNFDPTMIERIVEKIRDHIIKS